MKRLIITLLICLSFQLPAFGDKTAKPQDGKLEKIPTPAVANRMAAADARALPFDEKQCYRYFFTTDRSPEFYNTFAYSLNTSLSHATTLIKPTVLGDGWLIRVNLRDFWPKDEDFNELIEVFEKLGEIDPYFHQRLVLEKVEDKEELVPADKPYYQTNAQGVKEGPFTHRRVTRQVKTKRIETSFALHLAGDDGDVKQAAELGTQLGSVTPILRADWFHYIISTANPAENGRYYQFRKIRKSQKDANGKVVKTAETLWLESRGVNYETIQNIRTDQRIGMGRSQVTGKARAIEYFYSSSTRAAIGPAVVMITRDYNDGPIDVKRHPLKNLLNYKHDGTEAMAFLANGMIEFVLFDGAGELTDVAPQALVTDKHVPDPHPKNLQAPISCIRCHGPTDMWMSAPNNVMTLVEGGLNIYDDESSKEDAKSTLDRLAGLYTGDLEDPLKIARNTHAKATSLVTNLMTIPQVAQKYSEIYRTYRYDPVTPQTACLETGYRVDAELSMAAYQMVLPPLPKNRFGISPETLTIGTLRIWKPDNGLTVNRDDWEQEYGDAMLRVTAEAVRRAKLAQEVQK